MQGNLHEIDLRSLLQLIELGQRTGQLLIEVLKQENHDKSAGESEHFSQSSQQSWWIFFLNGQIIYCQREDSSLSRVEDCLRYYRVEMGLDKQQLESLEKQHPLEYGYIWALLDQNLINPKMAENIIYRLICETLFDLLSLTNGRFSFLQDIAIAPQLTTWEISPLVSQISQQLQEWYQLSPYIQSPEQLPILANTVRLHSSLPQITIDKLKHWADGKTSLRQLARHLNRDILTVAKAIYPYTQQGWLRLTSSQTTHTQILTKPKVKILCIDDTKTICATVESILQPQGYEVIAFTNPLEALSLLFQLQPDLILCDLAMPELDGYQMCAMLRQSQAFRYIPMIMLTSEDKFIDQIRAKMVGATAYLTKPVVDTELLTVIKKYVI
ncbi:response regulator [Nostoc sp. TCL26-01]|uniref:response regulator n=1 Tax=Nostoc sp. TCL26-01 TaxID=2576904 RepID=UPI0015B9D769|nr:response regulator [Nostoc sp. TCL26-01]QLE54073.1 response regulator [Nostoc sp. TCL26-01]